MEQLKAQRGVQRGRLTRAETAVNAMDLRIASMTVLRHHNEKIMEIRKEYRDVVKEMTHQPGANVAEIVEHEDSFDECFEVLYSNLSDAIMFKDNKENRLNIQGHHQTKVDAIEASLKTYVMLKDNTPENELEKAVLQAILDDIDPMLDEYRLGVTNLREDLEDDDEKAQFDEKLTSFNVEFVKLRGWLRKQIGESANQNSTQSVHGTFGGFNKKTAMKMPKLTFKAFNGAYDKWTRFKDMFESAVHNNDEYDDIVKFQYLVSLMEIPKGESNVLDNYPVTADEYQSAWEAVCDRYGNKRKILAKHTENMLQCEKMEKASAQEVRRVLDTFASNLSSLKQLDHGIEDDKLSNLLITKLATNSFDEETMKEWRKYHLEDTATWKQLETFLKATWTSLEDVQEEKSSSKMKTSKVNVANEQEVVKCSLCGGTHAVWSCTLTTDEKWNKARDKGLCFNCLKPGHRPNGCPNKVHCKKCDKPHHTSLHRDFSQGNSRMNSGSNFNHNAKVFRPFSFNKQANHAKQQEESISAIAVNGTFTVQNQKSVMLSTVMVLIEDADGMFHQCRALMDQGSQTNFITAQFAKRLGLEFQDSPIMLSGVTNKESYIQYAVTSKIKSHYGPCEETLEFSVLDQITGNIPSKSTELKIFELPNECKLADPKFHQCDKIDLLMNNEVFCRTLLSGKKILRNGIIMIETMFGWIIGGSMSHQTQANPYSNALLSAYSFHTRTGDEGIDEKLEKFLQNEEFESMNRVNTAEERYCEQHFVENTTKADDGKFIVKMPFKEGFEKLGSNYGNAMRQIYAQEDRRKKNEVLNNLYVEAMTDFIDSEHMEKVSPHLVPNVHYLPHHGVLKMSSTSTKLRPVFNASCKSQSGQSLNDVLCVGPTIQPESYDIMIRFREHKYVIMADIKQMYRQIWIHPSQRRFLRVLWRPNFESPIEHYESKTVTFGTACAPFLAIRCLKELANECRQKFPAVADALENSFYVDDLTKGVDSIDEGRHLLTRLRYVCLKAGFPLTKIAANSHEMLDAVPKKDWQPTKDNELQLTKALGISYDVTNDNFKFDVKPMREGTSTKTTVLSEVASIYDLMGFIAPVRLQLFLFMKKLWRLKVKWDEKINDELQCEWNSIRMHILEVNNIRIKRYMYIESHKRIEIHGFCDASENGYGAVIYALSYDADENSQVSIITAKTRLAPESLKSLPRLELCGATLLSKLAARILTILKKPIDSVTLWSDSTIVLHWICTDPHKLTVYVANRVAAIQQLTSRHSWKHIEGKNNPADVLSRGILPEMLSNCKIWLEGPTFFKLPQDQWPISKVLINNDDPEVLKEMKKKEVKAMVTNVDTNETLKLIETRFSRINDLIDTVAHMNRFCHNSKLRRTDPTTATTRRTGDLSADERENAEKTIIRVIQNNFFREEMKVLKEANENMGNNRANRVGTLPQNSQLASFSPFIDIDGILRIGGRMQNNLDLPYDKRHPIILPPDHFAKLIIRAMHENNLHVGKAIMKSHLREKYWILRADNLIKKVSHECLKCFRAKPRSNNQLMSNLPASRITMAPPFMKTAIDYAGFFMIKSGTTRKAPLTKAYIVMFKCMVTGAIHLELASDLTTKEFLDVLTRFFARRGFSSELRTDNATYFVGGNNEFQKIMRENEKSAQHYFTMKKIKWIFTTPRAPHAGGYYEAGIKSVKYHLKRIMDGKIFTFEQFSTILCRIEAILNSRPISPMEEDPSNLEILTPGHFLVFRPLISQPERNYDEEPASRRLKWEIAQQVQQKFWTMWHRDYLQTLQKRPRQFRNEVEFKIGDMVLVMESNLPTMQWKMGRITKLYPGKDHVVRKVEVRTENGVKDRHVNYLCLLPFNDVEARQNVATAVAKQ